jgi:hypothetical protein
VPGIFQLSKTVSHMPTFSVHINESRFPVLEASTKMKPIMGILSLVIVLAIGYHLYTASINRVSGIRPPKQQIDMVGIQGDLLSLAQAERLYCASNGTYATLKQLQQAGNIQFQGSSRRGYLFNIEIDGFKHFRITAKPADPARADGPTLATDETQQISAPIRSE